MVNTKLRQSLSQNARRLITGRMTNDAFDVAYADLYETSTDHAVSEIALFFHCLYSSDLLFPLRLRGRFAVDDETRSVVARAVLFLRSGLKYEWPLWPENSMRHALAGLAKWIGVPAGLWLTLKCAPDAWLGANERIAGLLAILGVVLSIGSAALAFFLPRQSPEDWKRYRESGDYDVWPFVRRDDFNAARKTYHMLRK